MSFLFGQNKAPSIRKLASAGSALLVVWIGTALAENELPRLPIFPLVSTTVANGELNPYGVAFVPADFRENGPLKAGDLLVSNFNNSANTQGTGSTIVKVNDKGETSLFFSGSSGLGLTTALGVLKEGIVLVGSLFIPTGSCPPPVPGRGAILVVDRNGQLRQTLDQPQLLLNGPWDLTIHDAGDRAKVFVSNVLDGTVVRLDLAVSSYGVTVQGATQVASGYAFRCDPSAVVLGPTGLAYDANRDVLYVASTADNKIFAVINAGKIQHGDGTGPVIYRDSLHLHGPLGLVLAATGHLIVSNGDAVNADPRQPSTIVEFTPSGKFVGQLSIDPNVDGTFGIALTTGAENSLRFAAVNDNTNAVLVWSLQARGPH
jgi:hypothetical protein